MRRSRWRVGWWELLNSAKGSLPPLVCKTVHASFLNRTTGHWYTAELFEKTLAVRSERSRASGEVEERLCRRADGLRLRSATLRPNGEGSTASEKVYESSVG